MSLRSREKADRCFTVRGIAGQRKPIDFDDVCHALGSHRNFMTISDILLNKINDQSARLGVIGLGYVGLPLATTFAQNGFTVLGLDLDKQKLSKLLQDTSFIADVPASHIALLRSEGRFRATDEYCALEQCDAIFICVPTPMTSQKAPDLTFIESAARGIASHLRPGQLVILQRPT